MFIVIDSIDGGGKGEGRKQLTKLLTEKYKVNVQGAEFPVHNKFYYEIIHPALQEETTMNSASWLLAYLLDKTLVTDEIKPFLGLEKKDQIYLADGYFTTTIAYQSKLLEQVSLDKLIEYSIDFDIPKPDLAIFIDVDPEIAMARKSTESGHDEGPDMFEKSIEKQQKLRHIYQEMVDAQTYCKWEIVDGNVDIPQMTENLERVLHKYSII